MLYFLIRNPFPCSRPDFHSILNNLLEDQQKTLEVPFEDASTHKQATLLGGPLTAGENMYKTLQKSYLNNRFSVVDGEILYEAIDQYQSMTSSPSTIGSNYPAPYSAHTPSEPPVQNRPPPSPPPADNDGIYDDVANVPAPYSAHTPSKPLLVQKKARLPTPPCADNDDIYDDVENTAVPSSACTPNRPPIKQKKHVTDSSSLDFVTHDDTDELYDDIAGITTDTQIQSLLPNSRKPPPPIPPSEEIYDDIESSLDNFNQASSYEVPGGASHVRATKPPVPSGPRPPLLYEDPTDMDYEEI